MIGECNGTESYPVGNQPYLLGPKVNMERYGFDRWLARRHNDGLNCVFCDGHAAWVSFDKAYSDEMGWWNWADDPKPSGWVGE